MKRLLLDMELSGLPCYDGIIPDGKLHRYSSKDTPIRDEWYICHLLEKDEYVCVYGSWRKSHEPKRIFKSWEGDNPVLDHHFREATKKIDLELLKEISDGTKVAQELWNSSTLCVEHAYLNRKQVKSHGAKQFQDRLLIPVYDSTNKLISIQSILPDGTKKFSRRTHVKFGRYILGDPERAKRILVCEGFATGASIHEATGDCVAIAFSSSNLSNVGFDLQCAYPNKVICLCMDLGQAGEDSAKHWLEHVSKTVYRPLFQSETGQKDFNDMSTDPSLGSKAIAQILCLKLSPTGISQLMTEANDISWIIPNLIIQGSVNMIYAPAGIGKSAVCMEMGYCVSKGIKFWHYSPNGRARVLYVDGELSESENKSRWGSISKRHGGSLPQEEELMLLSPDRVYRDFEEGIDLYQMEWQRRLDFLIEKADLIFLDNLSTLTGSGSDAEFENRASSWIVIGNWLRRWKGKGKSFVVVHHANKSGGMRGTSRVSVDMMTQIRLEPAQRDNNADVDVQVVFEKAREIHAEWKKPYTAKLENGSWITERYANVY